MPRNFTQSMLMRGTEQIRQWRLRRVGSEKSPIPDDLLDRAWTEQAEQRDCKTCTYPVHALIITISPTT
jgi:hypothetical protein